MKLTVLSQPAPLVDVEESKLDLGLTGTSDRDAQIEGLILAAQAELDGPTGWVGVSIAEQSVELRLDAFDSPMALPYGPVTGVGGIQYLDEDGAEQTIDGSVYDVLSGSVVLVDGKSWPEVLGQAEAVRITYDVGISDDTDQRVNLMKAAIRMHVKMTFDMDDVATRRRAIRDLTQSLRVW